MSLYQAVLGIMHGGLVNPGRPISSGSGRHTPGKVGAVVAAHAVPGSMVVDDSGYTTASQYFQRQGTRYEDALKSYVEILNLISQEGIITGDTADALRQFASFAAELQGPIGEVMTDVAKKCTQYVSDVDTADQYLY